MRPQPAPSRRRAFMTADALAGVFLLAALTTLLATCVNARQQKSRQFAEQRRALSAAQEVLVNLQTRGQPTCSDPAAKIEIVRSGTRLADCEWVEVSVTRESRRATLSGLAPAEGATR